MRKFLTYLLVVPLALIFVAFAVANAAPLMSMSELGQVASTTLAGSAARMWAQGSEPTAILVAICAIVAPAAYLLAMTATQTDCMPL